MSRSHIGCVWVQRGPCCFKSPSTLERTFPSSSELGLDPIQGKTRAQAAILRYTNTNAYSRRLERMWALSLKAVCCAFSHILSRLHSNPMKSSSSISSTPQTTETNICWLTINTESVTCCIFLTNITKQVQSFRKNEHHDTVTMKLFYSFFPQNLLFF